jgi:cystinosin
VIGKSELWNPVSCLGYGKLALALIKCIPAIYWNCKRKDTTGWSIHMIILDFIGGIFSMASGELSTENGINVTKLALAIFSIAIDSIFIIQHFVLFRKKPKKS